ncbi:hypothetical protein [Streptomyces sp. NPDC059272]|uniref:hypothetical protein n=1 Tax=Streptomyces sp. NPDC059272 TaxID=3346800 RepID=UPI00369BF76E
MDSKFEVQDGVLLGGAWDADRLVESLADLGLPLTAHRLEAHRTLLVGTGLSVRLDMAEAGECDPVWWAASALRRRLREVPDRGACRSPGLSRVLRDGSWRNPRLVAGTVPDPAGVMLFKPGMAITPRLLSEIAERLAESGYVADRARVVTSSEIRSRGLASRHYRPGMRFARDANLTSHERARFLAVYDRPGSTALYGVPGHELPVAAAYDVIERRGLAPEALDDWATRSALHHGLDSGRLDGPNCVGDCLHVNVLHGVDGWAGGPVAVLNPHVPGLVARMEARETTAVAILVRARSATPLPWWRVRREVCGVTDPAKALPGSLRGDAAAGLLPLARFDGAPVTKVNNGVHLSNGAMEALHDAWTWFDIAPDTTVGGRVLSAAGLSAQALLTEAFVRDTDGRRRAVSVLTDGLDLTDARDVLVGAGLAPKSS